MPSSLKPAKSPDAPNLGENIKRLRGTLGWNLSTLARKSGLPQSTLSKVEGGQMSLSFPKLLKVSKALGMDVRNLFATRAEIAAANGTMARRVFERHSGEFKKVGHYRVQYLNSELKNRLMFPLLFEIEPVEENSILMMDIIGERFAYVLEGPVEFRCEQYETVMLQTGDSLYVDAGMPHAFVSPAAKTARVLTVLTSKNVEYLELVREAALEGSDDASDRYRKRLERIARGLD